MKNLPLTAVAVTPKGKLRFTVDGESLKTKKAIEILSKHFSQESFILFDFQFTIIKLMKSMHDKQQLSSKAVTKINMDFEQANISLKNINGQLIGDERLLAQASLMNDAKNAIIRTLDSDEPETVLVEPQIEPSSTWTHHNGNVYHVVAIVDNHVIYIGKNQKLWAKDKGNFLDKMTPTGVMSKRFLIEGSMLRLFKGDVIINAGSTNPNYPELKLKKSLHELRNI